MTFRRRGCGIEHRPLPHPTLHGHALGAGLQGVGQIGREHTSQCVDGDGGSGQHLRKGGPAQPGTARVAARGKHRAAYGQVEFKAAGMTQVISAVAGRSQQGVMLAQLLRVHTPCPATSSCQRTSSRTSHTPIMSFPRNSSSPRWRLLAPPAPFDYSLLGQRQQIRPGQMQPTSGAFRGKAGGLFGMATADQQAHVMAIETRQGFGQQMREGVCGQVGLTQQHQTRQAPACPADHR